MKETLEEMVNRIKAELQQEIAKREDSEHRHAITCEALEFYANSNREGLRLDNGKIARNVLNGVPV